jgi:hypothetical protein
MCVRTSYCYFKFRHLLSSNAATIHAVTDLREKSSIARFKIITILIIVALGAAVTTGVLFINFDGSKPVTRIEKIAGDYIECARCAYERNNRLLIVQGSLIVTLIVLGCLFSFLVRRLPDVISGGRVLAVVMTISIVVIVLTLLVKSSVEKILQYDLTQTVGISIAVIVGLSLIFLPTFYKMMKMGDKLATRECIDEVLHSVSYAKFNQVHNTSSKKGLQVKRSHALKKSNSVSI